MVVMITSLPAEIINEILHVIDDPYTLLQLMQCSRYFHDITVPHLYRDVTVHQYCVEGGSSKYTEVLYWKSYGLACRVLSESKTAALVKSLSVLGVADIRWGQTRPGRGIPCNLLDRNVVHAINSLQITDEERDSWFEAFHDCCDSQVAIAIMLPFLPNLQRLNVIYDQDTSPQCIEVLKQTPCDSSFQALKQVSVRQDYGIGLSFDASLAQLFKIPSLLEISLDMLRSFTPFLGSESIAVRDMGVSSSNITTLSFTDTSMDPEDFGEILLACRTLKVLNIGWYHARIFLGDSRDDGHESGGTEMETLRKTLQSVSSTCEVLCLEYLRAQRKNGNYHIEVLQDPLKPLEHFLTLKSLTLGMAFIFGVQHHLFRANRVKDRAGLDLQKYKNCLADLLPPHLEKLRLIRHEPEDIILLLKNVETVLSVVKNGSFRSLRVIDVEDRKSLRRNPGAFKNEKWISQVEDLARDAEVKFRFISGKALD